MNKTCSKCGARFVASRYQIKKNASVCRACANEYNKKWRAKRKRLGKQNDGYGVRFYYKRAHRSWTEMRNRCFNPTDHSYKNYGGRGITVCERWMTFTNFLDDMGQPGVGLSLDRINNDGNYEPGNCRWATPIQQSWNRRATKLLTHDGKTQPMSAWDRDLGFSVGTVGRRIRQGMAVESALSAAHRDSPR